MKVSFNSFPKESIIPVCDYVNNRKLVKYYNRETQAAMVTVGMLLEGINLSSDTPIFYATGIVEHEEYDLHKIAANSIDATGLFSNQLFIMKGMAQVSPITQFKILYNMTLCFISIEYGLKGQNAVIYSSASGLITNAIYASDRDPVIIGAGKVNYDGSIESGFAFLTRTELMTIPAFNSNDEGIEVFKYLKI